MKKENKENKELKEKKDKMAETEIKPKINSNFNKSNSKGLGKGLGALIRVDLEKDQEGHIVTTPNDKQKNNEFDEHTGQALIEISSIVRNPYQPRKEFDEEALGELANSIRQHGVITAITVRKALNGYELISGERRLRASIKAGLTKIPALVLDVRTNTEMLEIAIIENVQRENLNAIEVAYGYQKLIEECNYTQEQVALTIQSLYDMGFVLIIGEMQFLNPSTGEGASTKVFGKKGDVQAYNMILEFQKQIAKAKADAEKEELDGE